MKQQQERTNMEKSTKKYFKVIQITDTHLFAKDESEILGVKSNIQFKECLQKIKTEDSDADCIFLTGDISQDHTAESYYYIAELLSAIQVPVYWIPGNHDDKEKVKEVFSKYPNFFNVRSLSVPNWHFIFLDTNLYGVAEGFLSQKEIMQLKNEIALCDKKLNIAIVMHHHPIPVGTPLIDQYILKNNEDFWKVINGSNTKLVIHGHVHGDYHLIHQGISVHSSPATCLQWEKGTESLAISKEIGYKIHFFDTSHKAVARLW
jgi:Icc protein